MGSSSNRPQDVQDVQAIERYYEEIDTTLRTLMSMEPNFRALATDASLDASVQAEFLAIANKLKG